MKLMCKKNTAKTSTWKNYKGVMRIAIFLSIFFVIQMNQTDALTESEIQIDGLSDFVYSQTDDGGAIVAGKEKYVKTVVYKLDKTGTIEWKQFITGKYDVFGDIAQVHSVKQKEEGYLVFGTREKGSNLDFWIAELDSIGTKVNEHYYGGNGGESMIDLLQFSNGDYVIFGTTYSTSGGIIAEPNKNNLVLLYIGADFEQKWYRTYGSGSENLSSILGKTAFIDQEENIIFTGSTNSVSSTLQTKYGGQDIFVVKMNKSGTVLWNTVFGRDSEDIIYNAYMNDEHHIVVEGDYSAMKPAEPDDIRPMSETKNFTVTLSENGKILSDSAVFSWEIPKQEEQEEEPLEETNISDTQIQSSISTKANSDLLKTASYPIELGDKIQFGSYKGVPLTWTIVEWDKGKDPVLLCDRAVTFTNSLGLPGGKYGESKLRAWLNSTNANNSYHINKDFNGFLHLDNFSASELASIKNTSYDVLGKKFTDRVFLPSMTDYYDYVREKIIVTDEFKNTDLYIVSFVDEYLWFRDGASLSSPKNILNHYFGYENYHVKRSGYLGREGIKGLPIQDNYMIIEDTYIGNELPHGSMNGYTDLPVRPMLHLDRDKVKFMEYAPNFYMVDPVEKTDIKVAQVGDVLYFGQYMNEPLPWIIQDIDNNGIATVVSRDSITLKSYTAYSDDPSIDPTDWKTSSLRQWLNEDSSYIKWTYATPDTDHVFRGINPYADEPGFMNQVNFTNAEKSRLVKNTNEDYFHLLLADYKYDHNGKLENNGASENQHLFNGTKNNLELNGPNISLHKVLIDNGYRMKDYNSLYQSSADFMQENIYYGKNGIVVMSQIDINDLYFVAGSGLPNNPYLYDIDRYKPLIEKTPNYTLLNNVDIYYNGNQMSMDQNTGMPFIDEKGRMQVPLRVITESLGYNVGWNDQYKEIIVSDEKEMVVFTLGSSHVLSMRGNRLMDTKARLYNNRTYVPIRFATETLGYQVTYESINGRHVITLDNDIRTDKGRVMIGFPKDYYFLNKDGNTGYDHDGIIYYTLKPQVEAKKEGSTLKEDHEIFSQLWNLNYFAPGEADKEKFMLGWGSVYYNKQKEITIDFGVPWNAGLRKEILGIEKSIEALRYYIGNDDDLFQLSNYLDYIYNLNGKELFVFNQPLIFGNTIIRLNYKEDSVFDQVSNEDGYRLSISVVGRVKE